MDFIETNGAVVALEIDGTVYSGTEKFRDILSWDSIAYLSLISIIEEVTNRVISDVELRELITVEDICQYVNVNRGS